MTIQEMEKKIAMSYAALRTAVTAQEGIDRELYDAEKKLLERRSALLRENADDPKKLGCNEATREATLAERTQGESAAVARWERERFGARHGVELARLDVEESRCQLRLLEVQAATARE